jgi:hypothetical protein
MTESDGRATVIRSKRGKLAAQAITIVGIGVGVGVVLQATGLLSSSILGKLAADTGLPMVALAASGVAIALAIIMVRDSWRSTITLDASGVLVRDHLGSYRLAYTDIERVKSVPLGGVILSLRDPQQWLAAATGNRAIRRKTAEVTRVHYGGDVWFYDKHLDVGASRFIEMLEARMKAAGGSNAG